VYSPIAGEVTAVNPDLELAPEKINQDAYAAWLFKLKPVNAADIDLLMDAAGYQKMLESEEH
jgi:glycine cleavage system H protein